MLLPIPRLLIALLAALVLTGCRHEAAPPEQSPSTVTVARVEQRPVVDYHEFTGQTEAVESVDIRARVRGFLTKIHFTEGTEVEEGALLYEIDPRSYEAEVRQAAAEVDRLKAQLELAKSEEQRAKRLRPSSAITEEEYLERVAKREQAAASLENAQAALDVAKLELSYTKIEAPITGRVGRTLVTEGNLVGYNEPTLLTTLVRLEPMYVYFEATERNFLNYEQRIREQGIATASAKKIPLDVKLENEKDFSHHGVVDFRENRIDPTTGTIRIRGVLENANRVLVPGMFCRVRVPIGPEQSRIVVPETAVQTDQRGDFVLTVDADNIVAYRPVTLGRRLKDVFVVLEGLEANDRVIVVGIQKARPGSKVTPHEAAAPAEPQQQRPAANE
jgi:RND family efflux transporter MFP subunit